MQRVVRGTPLVLMNTETWTDGGMEKMDNCVMATIEASFQAKHVDGLVGKKYRAVACEGNHTLVVTMNDEVYSGTALV